MALDDLQPITLIFVIKFLRFTLIHKLNKQINQIINNLASVRVLVVCGDCVIVIVPVLYVAYSLISNN
jgi:hypothetical protein